jgi:hypothetical protein
MATKKDAYYFSHDANAQDDPKCMILIDQLGMEGYGIFWALIEKLRSEKDYKLPFTVLPSLARRWGTSKEKVESVVKLYSLFSVIDDQFFSERLMRSMNEKSEKARLSASYRWNNANALQSHTECKPDDMRNDAIKGKESKENESIIVGAGKPAEPQTVEVRKTGFYNELKNHTGKYSKDILRNFYNYWSELNKSGKKMRFELERTWETEKRLATWASRGKPETTTQPKKFVN